MPLKHGSGTGKQIDLLYIEDVDTAHYLLIKDFNAFMRHRTKHHHSMHYCRKCLHGFTSKQHQMYHSDKCKQCINQYINMPEPGCIEFKATHKQDKKLFVVYFDFECLLVPIKEQKSKTTKYQKHVPCSFSIVTKSEIPAYEEETIVFSHEDPDTVVKQFVAELSRVHGEMMKCYEKSQYPIDMTVEDEIKFQSATHCHICKKELQWGSDTNYPVRDHDHFLEKNNFRAAACSTCTFNYYNRSKKVPALAHNL